MRINAFDHVRFVRGQGCLEKPTLKMPSSKSASLAQSLMPYSMEQYGRIFEVYRWGFTDYEVSMNMCLSLLASLSQACT